MFEATRMKYSRTLHFLKMNNIYYGLVYILILLGLSYLEQICHIST